MRTKFGSSVTAGVVIALTLLGAGCGDDGTQAGSAAGEAAPAEEPAPASDVPSIEDSTPASAGDAALEPAADAEALAAMQQVADELRAKMPLQLNETLRIDAVETGPGTLMTWYYTNPQAASTELDPQVEYVTRSSGIYENFCKPEKSLIRYGVTQHFVFRGNDGVEVTRVVVAPAECEAGFEEMLGRVAARLNEDLPVTMEGAYRLDSVSAGPGRKMTYSLSLLEHSATEFGDADAAYERFAPHMLANVCASEGVEVFFEEGVALLSILRDRDGAEVTQVDVTDEDCARARAPATE